MTQQDFDLMVFIPTVLLGIGTPFILLLIYFAKKTNKKILEPIAKAFPGYHSFFSWFYTGNYKGYTFTISFLDGRSEGGDYSKWILSLFLYPGITFEAKIAEKIPGPVLFGRRFEDMPHTEDGLYVYSKYPETAQHVIQNENCSKLIREIMEITVLERQDPPFKFLRKWQPKLNPFIFKKNKLVATISLKYRHPIDPLLVQLCLDKMILLAENLRTLHRFEI